MGKMKEKYIELLDKSYFIAGAHNITNEDAIFDGFVKAFSFGLDDTNYVFVNEHETDKLKYTTKDNDIVFIKDKTYITQIKIFKDGKQVYHGIY